MHLDEPRPPLSVLRAWLGHLALCVPLLCSLAAAAPASDFRDDLAAVRSLGLLPIGTEGWVSTVAAQLFGLLPIGGLWLRAAWVSAVATGLVSRLLYDATLRALDRGSPMPRLGPALALAAALTATLSEGFQVEGTIVGGSTVACALILLGLRLGQGFAPGDQRSGLLLGLLLGLCAAESHAAALALAAALVVLSLVQRRVPSERQLVFGGFALLVPALLVAAGSLVRPLAPRALFDLGFGLGQSSLSLVDTSAERLTAFASWLDNVGLISLLLGIVGSAAALLSRRQRANVAPWLTFVLFDLALPAHRDSLSPDPFAAVRLAALGALSLGAALGVQRVVLWLERARLPFSRPAGVLLVAFNFTLVLISSESSVRDASRSASLAAETLTDEALASLAPRALVVARSEAVIYRLLAAQLVRGERRDVIIVPAPLLERGGLRRRLLSLEPDLAPLLRETALNGRPSEAALGELCDVRPLYVELDATWDPRLFDHLAPRAFWIRYHAHALGNSDRRAALEKAQGGFERVLASLGTGPSQQKSTRAVLLAMLRERATLFDKLADQQSLAKTLERLQVVAPDDELLRKLGPKVQGLALGPRT